ncbi:DeoR/GlpR transcriptional regulator [Rhizobium sp. KVB221]|uniref:DeoR/GlpR transcriptional regulator n=1 Tax=Rhizobium setariae TaxID=2801340 RepID=A0A936YLD4_9HYPH|nr:DeoR/GlpR family DNA-binding transcription regulator [Rhizobium setariae]MBL0370862.1 DeoR/GlpR transcriptional regulator [Rhizobium setariae]
MLTTERKALIMDRIRRDGRLVAKAFAEELSLSEDTVRRDLREMASEGLLSRVHGGALPIQPDLPDFTARRAVASDEKRRLGAKAASMIQPGQIVFLDGGTTNAEIARALPKTIAFTIVTHSPTIATELEHHPTAEVVLIGGRLYKHSMVAVGAVAAAAISAIRPDIFFLGATAIHPRHGFSTGDFEEAAIKRQIAAQSSATWVLATKEKLDAASPVTIMPLEAATGVIASTQVEAEQRQMLESAGLEQLLV